ncbi:S-adenosyl-L-methionine-dependent methyltransferase [Xylaria sp. FL1042]|nr:S-adenosyl-L-methionine-dependent methyltransferase [Xylaria sp. FL1042]
MVRPDHPPSQLSPFPPWRDAANQILRVHFTDYDASDTSGMRAAPSAPIDVDMNSEHTAALIEAGGTDDESEFVPSDYDEASIADSASSIGSSIYEHSFHNGRRYHKFRHGRYPIPNDEREQNREDMLHAMMLEATNGQLFYAPIPQYPQRILDLGTGTGIWAIEIADRYPSAEVLGLDLSPIQPAFFPAQKLLTSSNGGIPSNCKFLVDDVEDTWESGRDWDFIHLRNMIPIIRNLRPGAWVELQDVDGMVHCDDGSLPPDWPILIFTNLMVEAFAQLGTKSHAAVFGGQYLADCGFVNIQHHTIKLPYGTWPRDERMRLIGLYYRTAAEQFLPASQYYPVDGMQAWHR